MLDELKQANAEIEHFLETFGDPNTDFYILQTPLRKEYVVRFSTTTIILCLRKMKTFKFMLRSMTEQASATVSLSPYLEYGQPSKNDKWKRLVLNHPPNPTDSMYFIILNTKRQTMPILDAIVRILSKLITLLWLCC